MLSGVVLALPYLFPGDVVHPELSSQLLAAAAGGGLCVSRILLKVFVNGNPVNGLTRPEFTSTVAVCVVAGLAPFIKAIDPDAANRVIMALITFSAGGQIRTGIKETQNQETGNSR